MQTFFFIFLGRRYVDVMAGAHAAILAYEIRQSVHLPRFAQPWFLCSLPLMIL